MREHWRNIGLAVAVLLALLALPLTSVVRAQGAEPGLRPAQPSVEAGATIRFIGENYRPEERVAWWATDPSQAVLSGEGVRTSSDSGYFEIFFAVPGNAQGGRWAMTAYGESSGILRIATFEVIGGTPGPEEFQAKVAPPSGPAGTTFAFAATGYDDNETLSYWLTAPDGTVFAAYPKEAEADGNVRVDLQWTAPVDAPRGIWVMTIQGYDSRVARGIRFEVL